MRASRLIAIAAAAGISAVILGCAAPTASGPIANGPASTTSPTPRVDAAAAFIAIVTDPAFSARIERTGTLTTNGVPRPDSGTYEFDAAYEHSAYVDDAGGGEEIVSRHDSSMAVRTGNGPWIAFDDGDPGSLASAIQGLHDLRDDGLDARDGVALHHLVTRPEGGITLEDLGLGHDVSAGSATIEFWVRDDGTPVEGRLTTDSEYVDGTVIHWDSAMRFTAIAQIEISMPGDVWMPFASERQGYQIAFPPDLGAAEGTGTGPDIFTTADGQSAVVLMEPQPAGAGLTAYERAFVEATFKDTKRSQDASRTVETGERTWRVLEYPNLAGDEPMFVQYALTVRGTDGVIVGYFGPTGDETNDRRTLEQILGTITLSER